MNFFFKHKITILGLALGAIGGFMYYYFVGCSGSCTIYSQPLNSTTYGALMGALVFNIFEKDGDKSKENKVD